MLEWHALLCLSLFVAIGDWLKGASKDIEEREKSRATMDVFEDKLVLDYLKQKDLALNMIPK